jgi:pimeloyl-ACP methyl ester carboxylesterase
MTEPATPGHNDGRFVRANGIDIYCVEAGQGPPLLLLHGGLMSNGPSWAGSRGAYVSHMDAFARHFRVIAPALRGHGKTVNAAGGSISYTQAAEDMLALIDALGLDRPLMCGFSAGATIATIAAIRKPQSVRALVNDAGYDPFNPDPKAPAFALCRRVFGGHPDATKADPDALEPFLKANGMQDFFGRLKADQDGAQGAGAWKALVAALFDALTWCPFSFEDLRRINAPTLILTGDRDMSCSAEEAVTAYRMLAKGELAILPNEGHWIPDSAVEVSIDFLRRCKG